MRPVIEFSPDAKIALSPEAMTDLRALSTDHAMNAALIHSLTVSKKEAREHLRFFKLMMIVSNGFSILGLVCSIVGTLLFLKFVSVIASMTRALRATEVVAKKHHLI